MNATWGADPDALDRLAAQMDVWARLLSQHRVTLNAHIHSAPWRGQEADRFRQTWNSRLSPSLAATVNALQAAQVTVKQNADQQRQASGVGAGSSGAPPVGMSGAGAARRAPTRSLLSKFMMFSSPVALLPIAMRAAHIKEIRIGDADNHLLISADGTVSAKANAIHTEFTENAEDGSFRAEYLGIGVDHTADGSYGVIADPGIDWGPVHLSAGLEANYNPETGVVSPSGEYHVGVDHVGGVDGSIHEQWNPGTGEVNKQVSEGYSLGAVHGEGSVSEHDGDFVSYVSSRSVDAGPLTTTSVHSQSVGPDGSFVDSSSRSVQVGGNISLDTKYFAVQTDSVGVTDTTTTTTTTTASGVESIAHTKTISTGDAR